eukprot:3043172-Prymnesium_polylepis.1
MHTIGCERYADVDDVAIWAWRVRPMFARAVRVRISRLLNRVSRDDVVWCSTQSSLYTACTQGQGASRPFGLYLYARPRTLFAFGQLDFDPTSVRPIDRPGQSAPLQIITPLAFNVRLRDRP